MWSCRKQGADTFTWGWSSRSIENAVTIEEKDTKYFSVRKAMRYARIKKRSVWEDIADREVGYVPKHAGSVLEVSYSDSLGVDQSGHNDGGYIRLSINGKPMDTKYGIHSTGNYGLRLDPTTMKCTFDFPRT